MSRSFSLQRLWHRLLGKIGARGTAWNMDDGKFHFLFDRHAPNLNGGGAVWPNRRHIMSEDGSLMP
jgi:hypothetical protein